MLSEQSADPDIERLLEGTAFLSSLINEKLDDDLPEIVHGLMHLIFPHYLRPIPSMTVMRFTPKRSLREKAIVPRGSRIDSTPVNDVTCSFTTCYDVHLHPLELTNAEYSRPSGSKPRVTLSLELKGVTLDNWNPRSLRFHLSGPFPQAAERFDMLADNLSAVRIRPAEGGREAVLPPSAFKPVGFEDDENLLPYPGNAFPGYRILQEYFILPEKFLFFDVQGLDGWQDKGSGSRFDIIFELREAPENEPDVKPGHFVLFASPGINLFDASAEPILLDHRRPEYIIRPSGGASGQYQVYSVKSVTGIEQGTANSREYLPFEMFNPQAEAAPVYTVRTKRSALDERSELFLSVAYSDQGTPAVETLSIEITCTNADLPESLEVGDINKPTETSPELADFSNIRTPTSPVQPPLGKNTLWRFLSHLYLNHQSLAEIKSLREVLKLYIFSQTKERSQVLANTRRIEALRNLDARPSHRIIRGDVLRGQDIVITLDPGGFTGRGDVRLFCSVLDSFLAGYGAMNNYTRLIVRDTLDKELFRWPARLGERPLL
jgi:type VI secretion system protein ImpG